MSGVTEEKPAEGAQRYVPKNKDANDAWVKGAQFIDLVNLGTKQEPKADAAKDNSDAVYINPAASGAKAAMPGAFGAMGAGGSIGGVGGGGFQPMAHLNE